MACLSLFPSTEIRADPYARMAKALTKESSVWKNKKAAVIPFCDPSGRPSAAGAVVAASLETAIASLGKFKLVERSMLDQVFKEISLRYAGAVASPPPSKIGALAGADLVIIGTVSDVGEDKAEVQARLIQADTGEVLAAVKARIPRQWSKTGADLPASPSQESIAISAATSAAGASRRLAGRELSVRYSYGLLHPVIRVTDRSDPERPDWTEIEIPYSPQETQCRSFGENFNLSGRKYRAWSDPDCDLHLAPTGSLLSQIFADGVDRRQEVVVSQRELLQSWRDDIQKNSRSWVFPNHRQVTAYVEPLHGDEVRVSLFPGQTLPSDVEVLRGRKGIVISSRLLRADSSYFRFYFNSDARQVTVEKMGED